MEQARRPSANDKGNEMNITATAALIEYLAEWLTVEADRAYTLAADRSRVYDFESPAADIAAANHAADRAKLLADADAELKRLCAELGDQDWHAVTVSAELVECLADLARDREEVEAESFHDFDPDLFVELLQFGTDRDFDWKSKATPAEIAAARTGAARRCRDCGTCHGTLYSIGTNFPYICAGCYTGENANWERQQMGIH